MLENVRYNLGREHNFYATAPPSQRSKEGIAATIRKEIVHEKKHDTTLRVVYLVRKRKRTICSIYLPQTNQVTQGDVRDLLEQLPIPTILLGDFNAHNPLWGSEKMSKRARVLKKILHKCNLLRQNVQSIQWLQMNYKSNTFQPNPSPRI